MGSDGQTIMKHEKLSGMYRVENSRCANLENYVLDPKLMCLIFGRKSNGIRPPDDR